MTGRGGASLTDFERRQGRGDAATDPEQPDLVDVHVQLDWLIRVRGTTDPIEAREQAYGYVSDQGPIEEAVVYSIHEEGSTCDPLPSAFDADEPEELTVVLYPEDETPPEGLEEDAGAAWSTYGPSDKWGRS